MLRYSPVPGEARTILIVWSVDDERKKSDARYWWTEDEAARRHQVDPEFPISAGAPKGQSLASLREEAEDGFVTLGPFDAGGEPVVVSLVAWADADPTATRFIVQHQRGTLSHEQGAASSLPPEVEQARQALRSAIEAGWDEETLAPLRARMQQIFRDHGGRNATEISPWNPERAVEVQPGVFVQDERPPDLRSR